MAVPIESNGVRSAPATSTFGSDATYANTAGVRNVDLTARAYNSGADVGFSNSLGVGSANDAASSLVSAGALGTLALGAFSLYRTRARAKRAVVSSNAKSGQTSASACNKHGLERTTGHLEKGLLQSKMDDSHGGKNVAGVRDVDHIEFLVGNAKQAAIFFQQCFGFQPLAKSDLKTGSKDRASYVLTQGNIRLVLTTPLTDGGGSDLLGKHGDFVRTVALTVDNCKHAFKTLVSRGAEAITKPIQMKDEFGTATVARVKLYGDVVHLLVQRDSDFTQKGGLFLPGFKSWKPDFLPKSVGLHTIDHVVGNVDWDQMDSWQEFYRKVFGFDILQAFDANDISTKYSALKSVVMTNGANVKLPINEPAQGVKKSQIEEYIDFNSGPGVQHLALATDDICKTVREMRARGVQFLSIPKSYYDTLEKRVGKLDENLQELKELNILVDKDEGGYMLQIFTQPLMDRPTFFIEVIQRKGSQSFGKGNFKALFESIEMEQKARGTLTDSKKR